MKGLYVITSEHKNESRSHVDVCQSALKGGASVIQYRAKNKSFSDMVEEALLVKKACQEYKATFIINDFIELAHYIDSDGLHLGRLDDDINKARTMLPDKRIGLSATSHQEAIEAQELGADYIGAGPVFDTISKEDSAPPFGLSVLEKINESVNIPVVAIGGISANNAVRVLETGIDAIAVISAVSGGQDMVRSTEELVELYDESYIKC